MARKICQKCKREMDDINFYTYKNKEKFQICKSCITMHVDNFNPETYLWILQKADVPYVPEEWQILCEKAYAKDPSKMNGMSVIGKYLSKMKLKQWNKYGWADSEKLQQERQAFNKVKEEEERAEFEQIKSNFEQGLITQAQYRTLVQAKFQKEVDDADPSIIRDKPKAMRPPNLANNQAAARKSTADLDSSPIVISRGDAIGEDNFFNENDYLSEDELPDLSQELTLEDKQYLAMKWGRTYKISEWIELEKTYNEMMNSFDIQDADSKNTLIFICKTYLKMNQAIDCGDVEGYQKLSRVYDTLRKSAKFTAAQNKEEKHDFIDSVSQLVAYCEKYGGRIPRHEIKTPYDIIDKIIDDLKLYSRSLIYEDTALARQIEDYIKQARAVLANKKDREMAKEQGLDHPELSDQDLVDFKDFLQKEKEETQKTIQESE